MNELAVNSKLHALGFLLSRKCSKAHRISIHDTCARSFSSQFVYKQADSMYRELESHSRQQEVYSHAKSNIASLDVLDTALVLCGNRGFSPPRPVLPLNSNPICQHIYSISVLAIRVYNILCHTPDLKFGTVIIVHGR
ncbi:hypothetical protein GGI43DRAFT_7051 [Trichoderma evansii]